MSNSPQKEITGKRPTDYSKWHRGALPKEYFMTDGDWFEQRIKDEKLCSVAYIETIQVSIVDDADKNYPVWPSKESLCNEIEEKMGIPAYIVWHNSSCTDFLVLRITESNSKRMSQKEYIEFIKTLSFVSDDPPSKNNLDEWM